MNIGKEPQSSINESNGVSLLKLRLQENGFIKCYFGEGDKTPNTDGFFVVNNDNYPVKEFHVQIKTTDILQESKGLKVYACDTKFINYANLGVTENPCLIFVVELQTQTIYFKYLSEKFLHDNNFTRNDQQSVSIHFNNNEILNDIESFYRLVCDIIKSREIKCFHPADVDVLEYQIAFDILNNFFDKDFIRIKKLIYPNIWKFGIAYQKIPFEDAEYQALMKERAEMGIDVAPYVSSFGTYAIEYGDKQEIFQNIDIFENDQSLKLLYSISRTNGISSTVEEAALRWLDNVFENWVNSEALFVQFLPNDALFEIVYNFLDKIAFELSKKQNADVLIGNIISSDEARRIITARYPQNNYSNYEIVLLLNAIMEITRRKIDAIHRVWIFEDTPTDHIRNIYYKNIAAVTKNNQKLFKNLPAYYKEFITNLFGENIAKQYSYQGNYQYTLGIDLSGNIFRNEYKYVCFDSDDFIVDVVEKLDSGAHHSGCGILNTSFKGDKTNILTNILSIFHKQVCKKFKFKQRNPFINKAIFY